MPQHLPCPTCHGAKYFETPSGIDNCETCEGEGIVTLAHFNVFFELRNVQQDKAAFKAALEMLLTPSTPVYSINHSQP